MCEVTITPRGDARACGALLLVATVLRFTAITFGLPHPQCRPDETSIVAVVNGFFAGMWNPNFFAYPALFMEVVALVLFAWLTLGRFLGYIDGVAGMHAMKPDPTVHLAARYVSAAAGVATVWLIYRLARQLFGRSTAFLAAAFLAVAFLHVRDSHFGVTDVPATFMAVLAFLFIVRLWEGGATRDFVAAAIVSGLAASTKYNVALIAVPAVLAVLFGPTVTAPIVLRVRQVLLFTVVMGVAFVVASPYSILDLGSFVEAVRSESRHLSLGHGVVLGRGWVVHLTSTLRYGLGLPMLLAGVMGMVLLVWKRPREGALVVAFPLTYYVLLGSGHTVFARYMVPVVPFLCLTAAYAVTEAGRWAVSRGVKPAVASGLVTVTALAVVAPSAWSAVRFLRILSRTDNRLVAASWIEQRFPNGATLAQVGPQGGQVVVGASNPREAARYPSSEFDPGAPPADLVVVQSSPLFPGVDLRPTLSQIGETHDLAAELPAAASHPANVYDWQDEFYMPLSGFKDIRRAGPNFRIFVRRDLWDRVAPATER